MVVLVRVRPSPGAVAQLLEDLRLDAHGALHLQGGMADVVSLQENLLDPAQQLAEYQGQWLAQPLTLNVEHLVYNTRFVRTPPATWDQFESWFTASRLFRSATPPRSIAYSIVKELRPTKKP